MTCGVRDGRAPCLEHGFFERVRKAVHAPDAGGAFPSGRTSRRPDRAELETER